MHKELRKVVDPGAPQVSFTIEDRSSKYRAGENPYSGNASGVFNGEGFDQEERAKEQGANNSFFNKIMKFLRIVR